MAMAVHHVSPVRGLPADSAAPRRKARIAETKKQTRTNTDIFADHWLVESPRKVLRQKTIMPSETPVGCHIDSFYKEVVCIPEERIDKIKNRCLEIKDYLFPRLKKLGNKIGISLEKMIFTGSMADQTQAVSITEVDFLLVFDIHGTKPESNKSGYYHIPLRKYREKKETTPDQFRFGRSENGRYLSSTLVARNVYDLVERALMLNNKVELLPFTLEGGVSQIRVKAKKVVINIIPACQPDKEKIYLVTRPYLFDQQLETEDWRVSHFGREKSIMEMMDLADRGGRRKAYLILKGLVIAESTLRGLSSYHLKTVLLHNFDADVDNSPRWQRDQVEPCFKSLLHQLDQYLSAGTLPHFFNRSYDLFANFPPRLLSRLRGRVSYLATHDTDVMRILKKR